MIEILSGQLTMESKFFLLGCYPKTYKEEQQFFLDLQCLLQAKWMIALVNV